MIRQCACLCRGLTPKRLVAVIFTICLVYIALLKHSSSSFRSFSNIYQPAEATLKSNHATVVSEDTRKEEEEDIKQTLAFLNNVDSTHRTESKSSPSPTKLKVSEDGICPEVEDISDLQGPLPQAILLIQNLQEEEISMVHPEVKPGGSWSPTDCKPRHKIAIIVPYRDRQTHLNRLLAYLIPILKRQRLDFRFIVTEQYGTDLFNKGKIMNAAFNFADKLGVDCVFFHDVDMFPQDDRAPYSCPEQPRHLGAYVNNLGYQLWYKEIVGGVLAVSVQDYKTVNGYSNMYWAWGGEDDDMGKRILSLNYTIERPDPVTARYSMLKHVKRQRTAPKLIYHLLDIADKRIATDGLNQTDQWTVRKVCFRARQVSDPSQLLRHPFLNKTMKCGILSSPVPGCLPSSGDHTTSLLPSLRGCWNCSLRMESILESYSNPLKTIHMILKALFN